LHRNGHLSVIAKINSSNLKLLKKYFWVTRALKKIMLTNDESKDKLLEKINKYKENENILIIDKADY